MIFSRFFQIKSHHPNNTAWILIITVLFSGHTMYRIREESYKSWKNQSICYLKNLASLAVRCFWDSRWQREETQTYTWKRLGKRSKTRCKVYDTTEEFNKLHSGWQETVAQFHASLASTSSIIRNGQTFILDLPWSPWKIQRPVWSLRS